MRKVSQTCEPQNEEPEADGLDPAVGDFDPQPAERPSKRARVEEVEDEEGGPQRSQDNACADGDEGGAQGRWVEDFPGRAGMALRKAETVFEKFRKVQKDQGSDPWSPLSQTRNRTQPSYHNKRSFFKRVDALPRGPEWEVEFLELKGDLKDEDGKELTEELELWRRNPVECVRELIGTAAFKEKMHYGPIKVYEDKKGECRIYEEIWTADITQIGEAA